MYTLSHIVESSEVGNQPFIYIVVLPSHTPLFEELARYSRSKAACVSSGFRVVISLSILYSLSGLHLVTCIHHVTVSLKPRALGIRN